MTRSLPWGTQPDRFVRTKKILILIRKRILENENRVMALPYVVIVISGKY